MTELLWILALPFLAALLTPLAGRVLKRHVGWWAVIASTASAGLLFSISGPVHDGETPSVSLDWPLPDLGIRFALYADGWGWVFALLVTCIGTLICVYAQHYLDEHEPRARFFAYLLLFEGAMLGVVLSANLIALVVFWELTSVASFLLIGFWHEQEQARYGAYKALLITGLGGLCLLAGVVLIYLAVGTFDLRELFERRGELQAHPWFLPILVLVLLGAFTKSAQFPFHFWLPDAMQAPTPVSAYLHSATMVKAGVFLLARLQPIFRERGEWFWIVSLVGLATMLLGAYAAVRKHDLKELLAYSTISQLGLITMLYGFGTELATVAATFHILNHAAFKAGLFLVVGIVDHETGTRDARLLSGLMRTMPVTAIFCGACALASAGVPLLNGFLSKELFYEELVAQSKYGGVWILWPILAVVGSVFTFVYSMELFHGTFFDPPRRVREAMEKQGQRTYPKIPHDPNWGMLAPLAILAILCVKVGLWPGFLEQWAVAPAVNAIRQQQFDFHIALFHGFTTPLMMSVLTLAAGLVVYAQRHHLQEFQRRMEWPFSASAVYDACVAALLAGARRLTDALQSGQLRRYFWVTTLFLLLAMGRAFVREGFALARPAPLTPASPGEAMLLLLLMASAFGVVWLNSQGPPAVLALGAAGFLVAVLFLALSAPDLALTQLLVESVVLILFLLALWHLPKNIARRSTGRQRGADALLCVAFGVAMCLLTLGVFALAPTETRLPDFYAANSLEQAGGRNMVNVILVDFRGFDTLGEIAVLGIAALGAYALVKLGRAEGDRK